MNSSPDPLEQELAGLQPHEVSGELRQNIASRLSSAPTRRPPAFWWLQLAGALTAACLIIAHLWIERLHQEGDQLNDQSGTKQMAVRGWSQNASPAPLEEPEPTILAYERALARSPEDVLAMLDRHAMARVEREAGPSEIHAFTGSHVALNALIGEE